MSRHSLRGFFVFCSVLLTLRASADVNHERLLQLGDAAYMRKAYDSAVSYYEQAASGKTPNAVALYKLGNAHYRLRHIGEAVLSYERALLYRPGFGPAARNARVIQAQVRPGSNKEVFFLRWWRGLTAPEISNLWATLAILTFAALLGALAWSRYRNANTAWLRPQVIVGAVGLTVLFVIFSLSGVLRDVPRATAVVMRPDTKFLPIASGGKGALALPEGLLLKVLHVNHNEITVGLPDGQEGFVQLSDIAVVE